MPRKRPVIEIENEGTLLPFFETGTEGVLWSVQDKNSPGYDGLIVLKKGDILKIFKDEAREVVLWEGKVSLEYKRRYKPYPRNPALGQQEVFGYWVHGFQKTLEPEAWATYFFDLRPCLVIRKVPAPKL